MLGVGLLCIWIWLVGWPVTGPLAARLRLGRRRRPGLRVPAVGLRVGSTRERRDKIEYELPEMIDLLVVTVEAGISLLGGASPRRARADGAARGGAPPHAAGAEPRSLGTRRTREPGHRADTPACGLVRGIIQGETLGMSIGQVMRQPRPEMRKKRKATAEERAQKAPIKMIFPLVFLIFPAMFIVLLPAGAPQPRRTTSSKHPGAPQEAR